MDLDELFRAVVAPVLDQLLRAGELDSVSIACPLPAVGPPRRDVLLRVVAMGEEFSAWVWTDGQVEATAAEQRARLASDLQDHIAESRFGWGELRPYREPA